MLSCYLYFLFTLFYVLNNKIQNIILFSKILFFSEKSRKLINEGPDKSGVGGVWNFLRKKISEGRGEGFFRDLRVS